MDQGVRDLWVAWGNAPRIPEAPFCTMWEHTDPIEQNSSPNSRHTLLRRPELPRAILDQVLASPDAADRVRVLRRPEVDAREVVEKFTTDELVRCLPLDPVRVGPVAATRMAGRPTRELALALAGQRTAVPWTPKLASSTIRLLSNQRWSRVTGSKQAAALAPHLGREEAEALLPRIRGHLVMAAILAHRLSDEVILETIKANLSTLAKVLGSHTRHSNEYSDAELVIATAWKHSSTAARAELKELLSAHRRRPHLMDPVRRAGTKALPRATWAKPERASAVQPPTQGPERSPAAILTELARVDLPERERHDLGRELYRATPRSDQEQVPPFEVDVAFPGDEVMATIWTLVFPAHQIARHGLSVLGSDEHIVATLNRWAASSNHRDRAALQAAIDRGIPAGILSGLSVSVAIAEFSATSPALASVLSTLGDNAAAWNTYANLRERFVGTYSELVSTCLDVTH